MENKDTDQSTHKITLELIVTNRTGMFLTNQNRYDDSSFPQTVVQPSETIHAAVKRLLSELTTFGLFGMELLRLHDNGNQIHFHFLAMLHQTDNPVKRSNFHNVKWIPAEAMVTSDLEMVQRAVPENWSSEPRMYVEVDSKSEMRMPDPPTDGGSLR